MSMSLTDFYRFTGTVADVGTGVGGGALPTLSLTGQSTAPSSDSIGTGTLTTFPNTTIPLKASKLKPGDKWDVTLELGSNLNGNAKSVTCAFNSQDCGFVLPLTGVAGGKVVISIKARTANLFAITNSLQPNAAPVLVTADIAKDNWLTVLATITTLNDTINVQSWSGVASNA